MREAMIARVVANPVDQFAQRAAQSFRRSVARGVTNADACPRSGDHPVAGRQPDARVGSARVDAKQASFSRLFIHHFAAPRTASAKSDARRRNDSKPSSFITSFPINSDPTPSAHAPAAMWPRAASGVTPPVRIRRTFGKGPRIALMKSGPRHWAGNNLTASAPALMATTISEGVKHPGAETRPNRFVTSITFGSRLGETMKRAPA